MRWSFATIVLVPRGQPFDPPDAAWRRRVFDWARANGFAGIELADEWLDFPRLSDHALREIKAEITGSGLQVAGLNLPRCLLTRGKRGTHEFDRVDRALHAAGMLGAEIVNISLAQPPPPGATAGRPPLAGSMAPRAELERAAELVRLLGRRAGATGAKLAIELHDDGLLDTPETCLQFLALVDLPGVGLNPDVGNICRGPGPLPDWQRAFELMAPRSINWHAKNYRHCLPVPLPDGDIDFQTAWNIMRDADYAGWVSIESRFGDVFELQRTGLAYLQSLAGSGVTQSAP